MPNKKLTEVELKKLNDEIKAKQKEVEEKITKERAEAFAKKNRDRQKKYYHENKEKMSARGKKRWAQYKALKEEKKKKEESTYASDSDEEKKKVESDTASESDKSEKEEKEEQLTVKKRTKNATLKGKRIDMTLPEVLEQISQHTEISKGTIKIYHEDAKRLRQVLKINDTDNLVPILKDTKNVIKHIEESEYALNVKKMMYQFILYTLDHIKIHSSATTHSAYKLKFDIYSVDSKEESKLKVLQEPIKTFEEYLVKNRERFGENSKMDIIGRLYDEFTPRDDFVLKIVPSTKEATDFATNYLVLGGKVSDKSRHYTIIINNFKTNNIYKPLVHQVSDELSNDIKKYMDANGIQIGMYLFGDKKLTKYVSENNARMGLKGGVNLFRHMKISQLFKKEGLTTEERVKKADAMGHSPAIQELYNRKRTE